MSEQQSPVNELEENEVSWLVFEINEQSFAVNCQDVIGIFRTEEYECSHMGGYSSHVRGVIDFRGTVVPLLELRSVLGMMSFEEEHREFSDMMDMRINDHVHWVHELERCVDEKEEFTLATDPHKCAFGQWYDNYESSHQFVNFQLRKVDGPHKKLHELAEKIQECKLIRSAGGQAACEKELLEKGRTEYVAQIVHLLEEMKGLYKVSYREMCIVLSNEEGKMLAILVDGVNSVSQLYAVDSHSLFDSAFPSSCINHVAKRKDEPGEVFVMNRDDLFNRLY